MPAARVYRVTRDGTVTEMITFGDIVPTGLAVRGATIYLAEVGPVPHLPATGTAVSFGPKPATATEVAAGSPLLVDVEFGRGRTLYALSQSTGSGGPRGRPRCPAPAPGQGHRGRHLHRRHRSPRPADLARVHWHTAYVVTLGGEIWKINGAAGPPCGAARQATTDPEAAVGALDKGQIGEVIALACTQTRSKDPRYGPGGTACLSPRIGSLAQG